MSRFSLFILFLCTVCISPCLQADSASEIVVKGNTRIDTQTVLSNFKIKKGDSYSSEELNSALEDLFKTGFFADVIAHQQGKILSLTVAENNIINQISFDGNKAVSDEILTQELNLRPREVYTPARIQEAAQKIRDIYRLKGHVGAQVDPKIIQRDQGRVDIVFEITEGSVSKVTRISFVGNNIFSDSRLRSVILTKTSAWYRFFSNDDSYEPERIAYDKELLSDHYLDNGYVDFRVLSSSAELSPDQKEFFITFHVEEGERYQFGKVDIVSEISKVDVDPLKKLLSIGTEDWFSRKNIERITDRLQTVLEEKGVYFLEVVPSIVPNSESKKVDVTFKVISKNPVYVNQILIQGNTVTDDSVIRREFRFGEGDAITSSKIRRSRQRLEGLDFFEKLDIQQENVAPDRKNVRLTVQEKQTGSLTAAGGYSTSDGPLVELKAMERNFRGKGQEVELKGSLAKRSKGIYFDFMEPYFLDRHLQGGFNLFRNVSKNDTQGTFKNNYKTSDLGGGLRLGYEVGEHWFQRWRYRLMHQKIGDVSSDSPFLKSMVGNKVLSTLGHDLSYNRLDNVVDPMEGYSFGISNDFTGLGGSVRYFSNTLGAGYYYPLSRENRVILNVRGRGGYVVKLNRPLRVADRYTLGGASLRGFGEAGVGPRDHVTGDSIGGCQFAVGTVEMTFPLGLPKEIEMRGVLFSDWGSLWKSREKKGPDADRVVSEDFKIRGSVGVGVRWNSPFGLIGVSFSKAVRRYQKVDKIEVFRFSIGSEF